MDAVNQDAVPKNYADSVMYHLLQAKELVHSGVLRENDDAGLVEELQPSACNWDCESVLSNYSNIDNHPGLLFEPNGRCTPGSLFFL